MYTKRQHVVPVLSGWLTTNISMYLGTSFIALPIRDRKQLWSLYDSVHVSFDFHDQISLTATYRLPRIIIIYIKSCLLSPVLIVFDPTHGSFYPSLLLSQRLPHSARARPF